MNLMEWTMTTEALLCAAVIGILGAILIMGSFAFHGTGDGRIDGWACATGCEALAVSLMLLSMIASGSDDTLGTVIMAVMALVFAALGAVVTFITERHQV